VCNDLQSTVKSKKAMSPKVSNSVCVREKDIERETHSEGGSREREIVRSRGESQNKLPCVFQSACVREREREREQRRGGERKKAKDRFSNNSPTLVQK